MISLNVENLLLRGSRLRNTDFIVGVAIYQGHDTKIMQNSAQAKYKFSKLELSMNTTIILTFCVQLVLALVGAVTGTVQTLGDAKGASYLGAGDKKSTGFTYLLFQQVGTWILIFTNFVPISLMVTVELVKFW